MKKIFSDLEEKRKEEIVNLHFDRENGTPFYLERWDKEEITLESFQQNFDLQNNRELKDSLDRAFRKKSYEYITPKKVVKNKEIELVGESGGTTGPGKRACFTKKEWWDGIIKKTNDILDYLGFPKGGVYLNVLPPYPPHGIGKYGTDLAKSRDAEVLGIDLDPRFPKKMGRYIASGKDINFANRAHREYIAHLGEQIQNILETENNINTVFTTPILLNLIAKLFSDKQHLLDRIEGIIFGGTPMKEDEYKILREEIFPHAKWLGVYGSGHLGLIGVHLPLEDDYKVIYVPVKELGYEIDVVNEEGKKVDLNNKGRLCISKFSESILMYRYPDEDIGVYVEPSDQLKELGVEWGCIQDITPTIERAKKEIGGVY